MLVHQWAESYRDDPVKYGVALEAMMGCVFLDCSDALPALFNSEVETQGIYPPHSKTQ